MAIYAVVLAGGGGTRLWPLSRPDRPKPFLAPLGGDTLLRRTVDRLAPLVAPADVFVVTDARYGDLVREQLPDVPAANILGEPAGRNTAAAVAFAAVAIDRDPDDVMLILPADHLVADEAGFRAVLTVAADAAAGRAGVADPLVTLGIRPTGPESGYGYIVPEPSGAGASAAPVARFVEKPDVDTAAALIAGDPPAAWNAGIFVWRRRAIRDALERHAPDIVQTVAEGWAGALDEAYDLVRRTSIDYAVMEPAAAVGGVLTVPADVGWSDLGSWAAIRDALFAVERVERGPDAPDPGTVGTGLRRDLGSEGTLVLADGRLVVTIGLRDTIVVDTPDAILVCAADRSQDVKTIAEEQARRAAEERT